MFNWLTVIVLFTVEIVCRKYLCHTFSFICYSQTTSYTFSKFLEPIFGVGYLEWLSGEIVKGVNSSSGEGEVKILKVVTDPFVDLIIQVLNVSNNRMCNLDRQFLSLLTIAFDANFFNILARLSRS